MLTTTQSYVTYQGNGAATSFSFNFPVQQASYLVVTITQISTGNVTVLSPTQYSVTPAGGAWPATSGTVAYGSGNPLTSDFKITIQRVLPVEQNTSLSNQAAFYPEVVEAALDYLTMLIQQLADRVSGSVP